MWITIIFRIILHPCGVTDLLTDVIVDIGVDMLSDMGIIVMNTSAITLEFAVVVVVYAIDVLAGLLPVLIVEVVTAIDVDMFADENVRGLAAVITPSKLSFPAESMRAFRCQ